MGKKLLERVAEFLGEVHNPDSTCPPKGLVKYAGAKGVKKEDILGRAAGFLNEMKKK